MDKMNHIKEHIIGNTYERIIFITRLSAIGDVIISSHTIVKLIINGYYPVFITSHSTKDIALRINGLDAFICHQKGKNNLYYFKGNEVDEKSFLENINNLKTLKKHLYVDLQKTSRSKRALKFITNDLNINFEKKYFISKMTLYRFLLVILSYFSFKKKIKDKKLKFNRIHETQEKLVKKIILKDKNFYTELNKNHYILKNNNSFFKNNFDYITIFPGASGFIKAWPKEKFRELIQKIINQTNYHIIICGLTNEIYLGEYLDYPQQTRIINLVNKTTLDQTLNIISKSKYIITNDSFAAHGADVFKIPASVLFGATSPLFGFVPIYNKISTEYLNLSCSPCSRHGKGKCRFKNLKCLQDIDTLNIFNQILKLKTKN